MLHQIHENKTSCDSYKQAASLQAWSLGRENVETLFYCREIIFRYFIFQNLGWST